MTKSRNASTLIELLRWRAARHPNRTAYIYLVDGETVEKRLTYGELNRLARAVGAQLQSLGTSGERALVLYPSSIEFIVAFWGCLYAGVTAVPCVSLRLNRPAPRIQSLLTDSDATFAFVTSDFIARQEDPTTFLLYQKSLQCVTVDNISSEGETLWKEPDITGDSLAFLQYTSGSTADPKGVMVSHNNILANLQMVQDVYQTDEESRIIGWLPLFHDMGLIGGVFHAVYVGASFVFMSPEAFFQRPVRWLQAITRYRGSITAAPNFAYDICVDQITPEQQNTLDLNSWRCTSNGAETIRPHTLKHFTETFGPQGFQPETFCPSYGLAEATVIVSSGELSARPIINSFKKKELRENRVKPAPVDDDESRALVGCGRSIREEKIEIVNPETLEKSPPDEIGEIWVSGPNVALGYWNRPEETKETFHACLSDTGEGPYLRTGDLGFLHDGELFIVGRRKDLIIFQARNYHPQDIERTVEQSHPALRPSSCAAFSVDLDGSERLVIVQEVHRQWRNADLTEAVTAIRWAIAKKHGLRAFCVALIKPYTLPKTSSDKIKRHVCQNIFLEGNLNILSEWRAPVKQT